MELETGKKYVPRKKPDVLYVEILKTNASLPFGRSCIGLVVYKFEYHRLNTTMFFNASGRLDSSENINENDWDLTKVYEPKLQETFYGIRRNGLLDVNELYLSEAAARANTNGGKVVPLRIEEIGE